MFRMLVALLALIVAVPAQTQDASAARAAIDAAMTDSAAGWNAGDIDRFLAIYSSDRATSFTTDDGVVRGRAEVRARYLAGYAAQFGADAGARSTLSFTFDDFRLVGADHALLIARYRLHSAAGLEVATGMTTLLFRREESGWKIVADHSS